MNLGKIIYNFNTYEDFRRKNMKYLTKEWYYGNKDICLDLDVDSNAEQYQRIIIKKLYNEN